MVVGEFTQEADLVIIGGGPAGYSAAFRAAQLGVQTLIVDSRDALGGLCLHAGCIPSKTLLHMADVVATAQHAAQFGIDFGMPKIDVASMLAWKNNTIKKLASGLETTARKLGVERIQGRAHFEDSRTIALTDSSVPRIRFRRALIATGSVQRAHPDVPFDGSHILTPGEALNLQTLPKSLLIVGGDYMALELATIFHALSVKVTLVHRGDRWLADADDDLARPLVRTLGRRLPTMTLNTTARLDSISGSAVRMQLNDPKPVPFGCVIVTEGHVGNTRGLQLEKTKCQVNECEFIHVNDRLRTDDQRIFAAGDVTGEPLLADRALHQGRIAAEVIAGNDAVYEPRTVPTAIFTDPQLAWCGITEQQAKATGESFAIARVPWGASGRAMAMGRNEGVTKIIYDAKSQLILGIGIVGPDACEMIGEAALAIEMGATLTDLAETIHPHPTMCELLCEAARQAMQPASAE